MKINKPYFKIKLLPFFFLVVAELIFLLTEKEIIGIYQPVIPESYGYIKDLMDVFVVVFFPWHGWVLFIPLIIEFAIDGKLSRVAVIFFSSSLATALIATLFNFEFFSLGKLLRGIMTYMFINFVVVFFVVLVFKLLKGGLKCLR